MVKFKVKSNPQGQYYFPKEVREELGTNLELVCNAKAAVMYSAETPLSSVVQSMEVIMKDLKHRIQLEKEKEQQTR